MTDRPTDRAGLDPDEFLRYSRHLTLQEVGVAGQLRLRSSRVVIVGAGGLGSPAAIYLAAAGIGRLGLVDFDRVEESNLQRQVLYSAGDVGQAKVDCAARRIAELNPHVDVRRHALRLTAENAAELLGGYEVVIDGTDNFATRYVINDACSELGIPNVHGSIFRFEGQASVFCTADGPCYRCLHPEPPPPGAMPNCAEAGVLGVLPGVIGTLQAIETIKLLLGRGDPLIGRLLLFDALEMKFRELKLRRAPDCPSCGSGRARPRKAREEPAARGGPISPEIRVYELRARQDAGRRPRLIDVRTEQEWAICRLEGATLIPLQQLGSRIGELEPADEIVVYCHIGARSAMVVDYLRSIGFGGARNLVGGIDAWAREIDSRVPRY